jgi:hypothetical protein
MVDNSCSVLMILLYSITTQPGRQTDQSSHCEKAIMGEHEQIMLYRVPGFGVDNREGLPCIFFRQVGDSVMRLCSTEVGAH